MKTSPTRIQSLAILATLSSALLAGTAQAWTVTAAPTAGPPGSQVTVSGKRFPPNSQVEAFLKWRKCSAHTDAQGSFVCRLKVPLVAQPGPEKIWTVHRPTGQWFPTAFTVRTDWSNEAFDGGRTRYNPYENVINRSNVRHLKRLWSAPGTLQLVAGGRVIIQSADIGGVLALDEKTGHDVWQRVGASALAADHGRLYFHEEVINTVACPVGYPGERYLTALGLATGVELWAQSYGCQVMGGGWSVNPLVWSSQEPHVVYTGDQYREPGPSGRVSSRARALSASDGRELWSHDIPQTRIGASLRALLVADGFAHIDTTHGCTGPGCAPWEFQRVNTALTADNGAPVRQVITNACSRPETVCPPLPGAAVAGGGLVIQIDEPVRGDYGQEYVVEEYVPPSGRDSGLIVSKASDGTKLWSWATEVGSTVGDPALAAGVVYVGVDRETESRLYAFAAKSGKPLWNRVVLRSAAIQPTVANGVIYLGRNAYDARNGTLLWTNPDVVDTVSPIVVNGQLYANQIDGTVSAWGMR